LKNDRNILPLDTKKKLAVIGAAADKGAVYTGVGSAKVIPSHTVTPLAGIQARAGDGMQVTYATGHRRDSRSSRSCRRCADYRGRVQQGIYRNLFQLAGFQRDGGDAPDGRFYAEATA
jgi:hypothetical protein